MGKDITRWTVKVDSQTDIDLRIYLVQQGMKKGDLTRFIEDAVKWRLFDLNLTEARAGFSDLDTDDTEALIGEAVSAARSN